VDVLRNVFAFVIPKEGSVGFGVEEHAFRSGLAVAVGIFSGRIGFHLRSHVFYGAHAVTARFEYRDKATEEGRFP
jgi:hypothetical protein